MNNDAMSKEMVEIFNSMPDKAKEMIMKYEDFTSIVSVYYLIKDKRLSPIEWILYIELLNFYKHNEEKFKNININFSVEPQYEIECENRKKYIADFLIYCGTPYDNCDKEFYLLVECDGYDFHQKTKKQVDYDNKREFDLKMEEYHILRFSGSEIYNDVSSVVQKIVDYVMKNGCKKQ